MRRRTWFILAAMPLYVLLVAVSASVLILLCLEGPQGVAGFIAQPLDWLLDEEWWMLCVLPSAVLTATQGVFLLPIVTRRPTASGRGKSLMLSLLALALAVAFICAGLLYALFDGLLLLFDPHEVYPVDIGDGPTERAWWQALQVVRYPYVLVPACWAVWSIVLVIFARRRPVERWWGRLLGGLLAGTLMELVVVIPIAVMVRRRSNCYCATGSFLALVFGVLGLIWLAGPGLLIAATSRRRRLWWEMHCPHCGYARGPSPGPRCPECGATCAPDRSSEAEKGD